MPEASSDGKGGLQLSFGKTASYNINFLLSNGPFPSACCYFSFKSQPTNKPSLNLTTPSHYLSCSSLQQNSLRIVYTLTASQFLNLKGHSLVSILFGFSAAFETANYCPLSTWLPEHLTLGLPTASTAASQDSFATSFSFP